MALVPHLRRIAMICVWIFVVVGLIAAASAMSPGATRGPCADPIDDYDRIICEMHLARDNARAEAAGCPRC
jgi:hypothetical protein